MLRNRRGDLGDVAVIIAGTTAIFIVILLGFTLHTEFKTKLNSTWINDTDYNETLPLVMTQYDKIGGAFSVLGNSAILILGGLGLSAIILAFFIKSHPIFLGIFIIGGAFMIMIAVIMANVFGMISESPQLSAASAEFGQLTLVMKYLPHFVAAVIGIMAVVMYTRMKGDTVA